MATIYRIHPAIGIARVGDSPDQFYLAPERIGDLPIACDEQGNADLGGDGRGARDDGVQGCGGPHPAPGGPLPDLRLRRQEPGRSPARARRRDPRRDEQRQAEEHPLVRVPREQEGVLVRVQGARRRARLRKEASAPQRRGHRQRAVEPDHRPGPAGGGHPQEALGRILPRRESRAVAEFPAAARPGLDRLSGRVEDGRPRPPDRPRRARSLGLVPRWCRRPARSRTSRTTTGGSTTSPTARHRDPRVRGRGGQREPAPPGRRLELGDRRHPATRRRSST